MKARYLTYSGRDPCWGCSRRLQAWCEAGQVGERPASPQRARHRRVRDGVEWPLCPEHKDRWEAHDMAAHRRK